MSGFQGRDGARAVEVAVRASADQAGVAITACTIRTRPWASVTFQGARHMLTLSVAGQKDARGAWLAALPDAELPLAHHIAVDAIAAEQADGSVLIEILTVERD